jgi:nucleoside-diphosphate-sugar epimerase
MPAESTRTAVLTGATSFIGRHLVRALLERGWHVHALARPTEKPRWSLTASGLTWHPYDGGIDCVQAACAAERPDVAFHLATVYKAEHEANDILPFFQANLLMGTQLAEALIQHGCQKLVNVGTAWQHYQGRNYDPVNLYAATKQAFEDILEYYVQVKDMQAITLKLYETYGPDDDRPKLLPWLAQAARQGKDVPLTPGEQRMHMVYIDDVIAAFLQSAERLLEGKVRSHECYAVAASETVSVKEFVGLIQEVLGQPIRAQLGARPYRRREPMVPWAGSSLPGWSCKVSLKEGLERTLRSRPEPKS